MGGCLQVGDVTFTALYPENGDMTRLAVTLM